MPCKTVREAVMELYFWQYGGGDNFSSRLFDLFMKADPENGNQLKTGFPVEGFVLEAWKKSLDQVEFFHSFGIGVAQTAEPCEADEHEMGISG